MSPAAGSTPEPRRAAALRRLEAFLPMAGRAYAEGRNTDAGPEAPQVVSGLSPYLRHRLLTEAEVSAAVLTRHGQNAAKFLDEVAWRTYWKGHLEARPGLWTRYQEERAHETARLDSDESLARDYSAAIAGQTGIDGFDHWARELVETGWLHNHARMWFASIWLFTLRLPLALGAGFFLDHLIDGDPASNTLSWRWVAGLHTRGKTYLATRDNIERYTNGRFAPKGLARSAEPLQDTPVPTVPLPVLPGSPPPEPHALVLTEDDLSPEMLGLDPRLVRLVILLGPSGTSAAPLAAAFKAGALQDTCERAAALFPDAAVRLCRTAAEAADTLAEARLTLAAAPFAPIGPAADQLSELAETLAARGAKLMCFQREWDRAFYPFCQKGFFALRTELPALYARLGIG